MDCACAFGAWRVAVWTSTRFTFSLGTDAINRQTAVYKCTKYVYVFKTRHFTVTAHRLHVLAHSERPTELSVIRASARAAPAARGGDGTGPALRGPAGPRPRGCYL